MQAEPLIHWPEPLFELLEFAGAFLAAGAVGFRWAVLARVAPGADVDVPSMVYGAMSRRAATVGLLGMLVGVWHLYSALSGGAARNHVALGQFVAGNTSALLWVGLTALALLGFLLARFGGLGARDLGWALAGIGVVVGALRNGLLGQFSRLVTPAHALAAGLWIGTLFVLVVAGLGVILRDPSIGARRGAIVAAMVNAFSPLALVAGGCVVLFGVITAWNHLKYLAALWTTPYGYALLAKLVAVAFVFGLGAWNWRRQRPRLGGEPAAVAVKRSATAELVVAGIVLLITSILVSLPVPRAPVP